MRRKTKINCTVASLQSVPSHLNILLQWGPDGTGHRSRPLYHPGLDSLTIYHFYRTLVFYLRSVFFPTGSLFILQVIPVTAYSHARMDDLQFYVLLYSISVISGRWTYDIEIVLEPRLWLRRFRLRRNSNSGPLDQ